ncbi:MAG: hypothetical protein O2923_12625, partial [Verrucomicrobia bacterium]|nr:hypothetical protein [Verrucomicrobiota bacterium]
KSAAQQSRRIENRLFRSRNCRTWVRIGQLDGLGNARVHYYENPRPSTRGKAKFALEGDTYHVEWRLLPDRVSKFRIRVTKPGAKTAEPDKTGS